VHELVVHDLSRAAAKPFLAKGAVWANSPKQVAEQVEIVFTSLPVQPMSSRWRSGQTG
jgi:3-hydroxyisobutyrate dehydrogenase